MSRTQKFRDQHRDIEALAAQIASHLKADALARDAAPVRALLSQLAGKVNVHLAMEDNALYPALLKHPTPAVQAKARAYQEDMGGIKQAFTAYLASYPSAQAIQADPRGFIQATTGITEALARRIRAEDTDLYALVDSLA